MSDHFALESALFARLVDSASVRAQRVDDGGGTESVEFVAACLAPLCGEVAAGAVESLGGVEDVRKRCGCTTWILQVDAGSKFQGRSSWMRDCGCPAAIFSSVLLSQA